MSFRLKIVLGIIVIQALILIAMVSSSMNLLRDSNEEAIFLRAQSTTSLLAIMSKEALIAGDVKALKTIAREAFSQRVIGYVKISRADVVVAEAGYNLFMDADVSIDNSIMEVDDGIFDTKTDIVFNNTIIGHVKAGYLMGELDTLLDAARRQESAIAALGISLAIVFAIILGNYFAKQLKNLRDATRRIAAGNVGYQLYVNGDDELAQTANAFNTMSRRLALLYSEKQAALNNSEQKAEALKEGERRINAILDNAMDGIITMGDGDLVDSFNPEAERIFGYQPGEIIGNSFNLLLPEPYYSSPESYLLNTRQHGDNEGKSIQQEILGRRKNGELFPLELGISEVEIDGHLLCIAIARDITAQKNAEIALNKAKDASIESARMKFEFIATVSNELRMPMEDVLGLINHLYDTSLDDKQREYLDKMHTSGDTLMTIFNDILDFSKIEAGQLELEHIDFCLQQTIEDVFKQLGNKARVKNLKIFYIMPPSVPIALVGDPARLRQIIVNLMDNAIKYTNHGDVAVRISVVDESADDVMLRFDVVDSGIGITPKNQRRISETFTKDDTGLTMKYGNTGLGLAISKKYVEIMGGKIDFESEVDHGSDFWFTLTLDKQDHVTSVIETDIDDLKDLKILLVEAHDDTHTHHLVELFEAVGIRVNTVEDGISAQDELRVAAGRMKPYDIIIFDMMMQKMSGLSLIKAINESVEISDVKVVVISSTGYRGDCDKVQRAGALAYLTAPVEKNTLYDCITAVMNVEEDQHEGLITRHSLADSKAYQVGYVLLIEEDNETQKLILDSLESRGYHLHIANEPVAASAAIKRRHYDVVVVDAQMMGIDLVEMSAFLMQHKEISHDCEVVVLCDDDYPKTLLQGSDIKHFIKKPFSPETLLDILPH